MQEATVRAAQWLLSKAESAPTGGLRWPRGPDTDGVHENQYFPTFCCGTAGVAYFLAALSCAEEVPMDAALRQALLAHAEAGAAHLLGLGVSPLPHTLVLPHEEEGEGRSYAYMGWCGGPPGWARLFVVLWQATADAQYLAALEAAVRALLLLVPTQLAMLVPTPYDMPPWANLGQCCGVAGAGTFLLEVAAATDLPLNASLRDEARRVGLSLADALAARAVPAGPGGSGLAVPSPEEHAAPRKTTWQAGWMQGASGVGAFLLHAHAVAAGQTRGRRKVWPDEPWSTQAQHGGGGHRRCPA